MHVGRNFINIIAAITYMQRFNPTYRARSSASMNPRVGAKTRIFFERFRCDKTIRNAIARGFAAFGHDPENGRYRPRAARRGAVRRKRFKPRRDFAAAAIRVERFGPFAPKSRDRRRHRKTVLRIIESRLEKRMKRKFAKPFMQHRPCARSPGHRHRMPAAQRHLMRMAGFI